MKQKFNKFETLFETAFSHFSNGGFREGSAVVLKPSFLKHAYFKKHYSGSTAFAKFLKELIAADTTSGRYGIRSIDAHPNFGLNRA